QLEPGQSRAVAYPDAEAEAPAGDLVEEGRRLRVVMSVAGVDVRDGRAEGDLAGSQGHRLGESQPVAQARTIDAGEPFLLKTLGQLDGGLASARHRGEADRGFADHAHGRAPPQRFHDAVSEIGLRRLGPYFIAG